MKLTFQRTIFLGVIVSLFLCVSSWAQTAGTGALTGTVKDPSGAVVPSAMVTATSLDSGQVRTAMTGSDGSYKFNLLPPGNYRVRFEAPGFKPVEIPAATVSVTETSVLDRNLEVGAQTQAVTVEGEVETIQTTSSALGTVVNTKTVTDLPLNTRNFTNLLAMSTGVSSNVTNATTLGKGATDIVVNGGGAAQNTYLEDGVPVNNWYSLGGVKEGPLLGSFAMPNPDAIAEFKIQTSTYDAGYGRNPGSNVNVITKSGTNNFHGAAFEFFRNTVLNANDWFFNYQGLPRPVLNSNQYGGAFGGPVKKDKLFFFVSYQESDQRNGIASFAASTVTLAPIPGGNRGTCPTGWTSLAQCDAAAQTFVPALASAICPGGSGPGNKNSKSTSVVGGSANSNVQVQCPGSNTDPLFNINPIAVSLLQLKLGNGNYLVPGSGTADYVTKTLSDPVSFQDHQGLGNWDYVINSKHTLSGRYIYETDPLNANFPALNALEPGNALPGNSFTTAKTNHEALLKLTSILSNNLINEARISFQRYLTVGTAGNLYKNSQVGVADLTPGTDNLSYWTVNGAFAFGSYPFFDTVFPENQFEWADQISLTHGKHTFRTGFEAERIQANIKYPGATIGTPTFPRFADFLIGRAGCPSFTGVGNCSPANPGNTNGSANNSNISSVSSGTIANSSSPFLVRSLGLNAFVQDDFKVSSRLNVNLGLRWEYDGLPIEKYGNFSDLWPSLATAAPAPIVTIPGGAGSTLLGYIVPANYKGVIPVGIHQNSSNFPTRTSPPKDNFAPRLGFAWQPTSSNRLVVRGGFGSFLDLLPGYFTGNALSQTGPLFGPPANGAPTATMQNPWALPPGVVGAGPGIFGFQPRWVILGDGVSKGISGSNLGGGPLGDSETLYAKAPVTYAWNLSTQWEFLPSWVLEVGYVGSHGIHQATLGSSSGPTADGSPSSAPINIAQLVGGPCASCALTGVTVNTTQNTALRTPILGVLPNVAKAQTNSNYKYNSLQTTLRKQLSHGLQLQAAYTWGRAFNQAPFGINTYPYWVYQYGPNNSYHPSRFVANYTWNLPFGHPKGFLGELTDGWSLSGVTIVQSGVTQTINDSGGGQIFGNTGISTAQYCPGMGAANIATAGTLQQRVTSGLTGGTGYYNIAAFCTLPTVGATPGVANTGGSGYGNVGFGTVRGPDQSNWDMSLAKLFKVRESQNLQFRAEFFNTFNHPQFSVPASNNVHDGFGTFGQITSSAVNPRIIQFALKYLF
jgi:hypothetical protein